MFGIYVHIPFCVHRCSYCDFYSSTQYGAEPFRKLAEKIQWESRSSSQWLKSEQRAQTVTSIFLGGGTPSLLPMEYLEAIFTSLKQDFDLSADIEITLEANPETVTEAFARELVARTPVNRVSLGAQSFEPAHLKTLERLGSPQSICTAIKRLRGAGISRLSLDLIFGIPGQTSDQLVSDIELAAALSPDHLSFYSLTLKPGHKLYAQLPCDDIAAELYEVGKKRLGELGYFAYEISNFSRPQQECRHNLLYWSGGDFLGLGPSAASRFFWDGRFHHKKQVSSWEKYLEVGEFPYPSFESTSGYQTVLEATFLEIRKARGIDTGAFNSRYGYRLQDARFFPILEREGLLDRDGDWIRLSKKGWLLAEGIAEKLVDRA